MGTSFCLPDFRLSRDLPANDGSALSGGAAVRWRAGVGRLDFCCNFSNAITLQPDCRPSAAPSAAANMTRCLLSVAFAGHKFRNRNDLFKVLWIKLL